MRLAMAQINPTVGDLEGNSNRIREFIQKARMNEADLVIFPELAITGYPPQDLLLEPAFIKKNKDLVNELIKHSGGMAGIIGFVDYKNNNLFNAAAIFSRNKLVDIVYKTLLPTYDVFDEARYFTPARLGKIRPVAMTLNGKSIQLGVEICEDLWDESYNIKVTDLLVKKGANIIVNISSSPFYTGKRFERLGILTRKSKKHQVPIFYINLVGGQDELVFDGQSIAVDRNGDLIAIGKQFEEDLIITELDPKKGVAKKVNLPSYN
jgi:NAD+ synthase (glutamine-hydrolysing)